MAIPELQRLRSEAFLLGVLPTSGVRSLHRRLRADPAMLAVREAVESGGISEPDVRDFVRESMREFEPGQHFIHDETLAALAVALEFDSAPWVRRFLRELAALSIHELPMAPRVAASTLL